ncbi:hypothetical protein ACIBTV_17825 [Micromonospora sp. NPDC049366]|uniref:LppU/SCO3897 family protein n=1 Tax=Micromonospora sp. NPDC049366 TaxID=3364271 RepID=UPI003798707D
MTSEGPHHPGQEPDEVSPGAGGPAPYGDRPAHPGNGYGTAGPDLGWAPPPPAGSNAPAPAWGTPHEQNPAPQWGSAQVPQSGDTGQPGGAQPAWGAAQPEQSGPAWAATGGAQPGWGGQPEQSGPAWAGAAEQPAWAQAQPAVRGAAQVPAPAWSPEDPAQSGAWAQRESGGSPQESGWGGAAQPGGAWTDSSPQQSEQAQAGGWAPGGAAQDDPAQSGWDTPGQQQNAQPGWGPAEQAASAWPQAEQAARGAAQVPASDDPARSGGWVAQDPAASGSWQTGAAAQPDEASGATGWGAAGTPEDRQRQPDWVIPQDDARAHNPPTAWGDAAGTPAQDDPSRSSGWATSEPNGAPARASAAVPGGEGTPGWAAGNDSPAQWAGAERATVPDVEPWAASEAWGSANNESAPAAPAAWQAERDEEPPAYQPGPAPGISAANAVPLPPQEQRVPGASLAAAPPADYAPHGEFASATPYAGQPTSGERPDWPNGDAGAQSYEAEQAGWGQAEAPSSPAAPAVPAPRTSPESGAAARAAVSVPDQGATGRASASASVPLASRVMPPADQSAVPTGSAVPQPRVYGRPSRPEPADEPAEPETYGTPERRDEPGPEPRFDDFDRVPPQNGFAEAGPVNAGPPAPPAFPPALPAFADAPSHTRPMNGVRPHPGAERPGDPYGAHPGAEAGLAGVPGYGPPPSPPGEQGPGGGFPPAFPPPPQQQPAPSPWGAPVDQEADQSRFDSFKPDAEPKTEAPTPKVRNGRVLAAVLVAAVLILAVPLGLLLLLGKVGGGGQQASFDPAVGTCVKQSGNGAAPADCAEADAFTVVSKVDNKDKCADPAQPHVVLPGDGANRVLCLKPAASQ